MSLTPLPFPILKGYQIHKKLPYSDETVMINKQTQEFILMKEMGGLSTLEVKEAVESLEAQRGIKSTHVLQLIDYSTQAVVQEGRVGHKIISFYQYSGHDLLEEVNSRAKRNGLFDENQLWNILCSVVMGLASLQRSDIGHGCVSLLDIFITPDGSLKIADPSITSIPPSDFTPGYYYSPQMFQFFSNPRVQPQDIDIYRSDVFSLALCMLHIATLDELDSIMDYENYCIDFDELEGKIGVVSEDYSEEFVNVLVWMLGEGVGERPDFVELEECLVEIINERDEGREEGWKGEVTLSMQFEMLNLSRRGEREEEVLEPMEPEREDGGSQIIGIPEVRQDQQIIDISAQPQVKNSIKISEQNQPSEIILTESVSYHNTQRSNFERKEVEEIEAIVFKKVESREKEKEKEKERERESLLSEIGLMVMASKDNLLAVEDLFPRAETLEDTLRENGAGRIQEKVEKKVLGGGVAKGVVARKWNVVKQPPKTENRVKALLQPETENQKNKVNSTLTRPKKIGPAPETKAIKRATPATKSSRPNPVPPPK